MSRKSFGRTLAVALVLLAAATGVPSLSVEAQSALPDTSQMYWRGGMYGSMGMFDPFMRPSPFGMAWMPDASQMSRRGGMYGTMGMFDPAVRPSPFGTVWMPDTSNMYRPSDMNAAMGALPWPGLYGSTPERFLPPPTAPVGGYFAVTPDGVIVFWPAR